MTGCSDDHNQHPTQHEPMGAERGNVIPMFSTPAAHARMIEERQRAWDYHPEPISPEARAALTPEMRYEAIRSTMSPTNNVATPPDEKEPAT